MNVENWKIENVCEYKNNPRKNDDAVEYVANSIREFGFRSPIIVDKDGVIICGHTRLKAALSLGLTEVPVHVAEDLTDEQVKALRLADNKTGEFAEWDFSMLDEELADIDWLKLDMSQFGFKLDDEIGFDIEADDQESKTKVRCSLLFDDMKRYMGVEREVKKFAEQIGAELSVGME